MGANERLAIRRSGIYRARVSPVPNESRLPAFARYAWLVLAYTLFVILFGAWVRISGSGAGCGDHWPMCNGEIVPRSPTAKTVIEFTHRVTSGVLGPMVIAQVIWAWRGGRPRALGVLASLVLLFVIIEALIGRSLVVQELVGENASVKRAVVVALHLGNTMLLMFFATATAWLGAGGAWPRLRVKFVGRGWSVAVLLGTMVVSMMGAVTALGDTLFPVKPTLGAGFLAHIGGDLSHTAHFLVRLRIIHPLLAAALAIALLLLAQRYADMSRALARTSTLLSVGTWSQLLIGVTNIALGAPGWVQLVHLLLAQGIWIVLVILLLELARLGPSVSTASASAAVPSATPSNPPEASLATSDDPAVLPIEDSIDLHAFAPRDVLDVVDAYLEAAHEKGFVEVRLIHGRGTGFQRARVQQLLAAHPLVERYKDAPATRGGWGATLAWLKRT
jgi:heme a synthase